MIKNKLIILVYNNNEVEFFSGGKKEAEYWIHRRLEKEFRICNRAFIIDENESELDVNEIIRNYNKKIQKIEEEQLLKQEFQMYQRLCKKFNHNEE